MELNEIKQEAVKAAATVQLNWEALEDEKESKYLISRLKMGIAIIPSLEGLYTKLSSGKSVLLPDAESSLAYEDVEKYKEMIAEELHAAYILQAVHDTYEKVTAIIQASGSAQ